LCWVRRDDREWFDGRLYPPSTDPLAPSIYLVGEPSISEEEKQSGGYWGRLASAICKKLHESAGFEVVWAARRRLAERIEKARADRRPVSAADQRELTDRIVNAIETAGRLPDVIKKRRRKKNQKSNKAIELSRERRERVVMPLLKGRSPHQWSVEAGREGCVQIDPGVVYDYLAGRSFPQPRYQLLLAKVIGLKKLPR
jgi:hypothetical protein